MIINVHTLRIIMENKQRDKINDLHMRLENICIESYMTLQQLATEIGIDIKTLTRFIKSKIEPRYTTLIKIERLIREKEKQ